MQPEPANGNMYTPAFFDSIGPGAAASADVIVPIIMELVNPTSVLDVGCGRGIWLKAFESRGVQRITGIDGPYHDRGELALRPDQFRPMDLRNPQPLDDHFDLALCLEVAEHLPASAGEPLVRLLTHAAPLVVFAAAVPGQGGDGHINERWPEYWQQLFAESGYFLVDCIRPRILTNRQVEYWYRQNIVVFCSGAAMANREWALPEAHRNGGPSLEWVHRSVLPGEFPGRVLLRMLLARIWQRLRGRANHS